MTVPITFTVTYNQSGAYYVSWQNNKTGRGGSNPSPLNIETFPQYINGIVREHLEEEAYA